MNGDGPGVITSYSIHYTKLYDISLGDKKPALAGLDAILDFNVSVGLGDLELSRQEVETILEQTQGLAFIKNKWVAVDPEKLRQALKACNRIEDLAASGMTLGAAMRARLAPGKMIGLDNADQVEICVSNGTRITSYNVCYTKLLRVDKGAL